MNQSVSWERVRSCVHRRGGYDNQVDVHLFFLASQDSNFGCKGEHDKCGSGRRNNQREEYCSLVSYEKQNPVILDVLNCYNSKNFAKAQIVEADSDRNSKGNIEENAPVDGIHRLLLRHGSGNQKRHAVEKGNLKEVEEVRQDGQGRHHRKHQDLPPLIFLGGVPGRSRISNIFDNGEGGRVLVELVHSRTGLHDELVARLEYNLCVVLGAYNLVLPLDADDHSL